MPKKWERFLTGDILLSEGSIVHGGEVVGNVCKEQFVS